MLKIPFQFFWNIQNFVLSWKKSVWKKKACFGDFSIRTKIAVSGPYRRSHFLVDFEYFLKCWKYPSNFSETFKSLLFHVNNQFYEKKACFGDFSIFGKIAVSGPYRRVLFLVDFEYFLKCWKYPSNSSETFKIFVLSWKQSVWRKKSIFLGFFNFRQNRCIRTLPAWPFFVDFEFFFEILEIPFQFFWNIQNFVLSWKQSVSRKESMFLGLFNFRQNRCFRTLPAWPFFGWFWVFFEMLKIPFQILWNIQNFVLSWKQSVWKKKACLGTFQFGPKSLYPDLTGVAIFFRIQRFCRKLKNPKNMLFFLQTDCFHERTKFWMFHKIWKGIFNISKNTQNQPKKGHAGKVRKQRFCRKLKSPKNMLSFLETDCFHESTKFWMFQKNWKGIFNISKNTQNQQKKWPHR